MRISDWSSDVCSSDLSIVGKPTAVTNFSHCDVADAEIVAARVEPDREKQLALWKTAQQKIMAEVCAVPIYENMQLWAWQSNLDLGVEVKGSLNLSPPENGRTSGRERGCPSVYISVAPR